MDSKTLLRCHLFIEHINELRQAYTRQGRFERGFISRDDAESRAAQKPSSDGGYGAARVRGFDEPPEVCAEDLTDREKDELILAAMDCCEDPRMQALILEVYCGGDYHTIPARIGVKKSTYYVWLEKLERFFRNLWKARENSEYTVMERMRAPRPGPKPKKVRDHEQS